MTRTGSIPNKPVRHDADYVLELEEIGTQRGISPETRLNLIKNATETAIASQSLTQSPSTPYSKIPKKTPISSRSYQSSNINIEEIGVKILTIFLNIFTKLPIIGTGFTFLLSTFCDKKNLTNSKKQEDRKKANPPEMPKASTTSSSNTNPVNHHINQLDGGLREFKKKSNNFFNKNVNSESILTKEDLKKDIEKLERLIADIESHNLTNEQKIKVRTAAGYINNTIKPKLGIQPAPVPPAPVKVQPVPVLHGLNFIMEVQI